MLSHWHSPAGTTAAPPARGPGQSPWEVLPTSLGRPLPSALMDVFGPSLKEEHCYWEHFRSGATGTRLRNIDLIPVHHIYIRLPVFPAETVMLVSGCIEGSPALRTMKIQYSGITIHLVTRCLIYTSREVKLPLDPGLGNSFMGGHDYVSKTEGRLLEGRLQPPVLCPSVILSHKSLPLPLLLTETQQFSVPKDSHAVI